MLGQHCWLPMKSGAMRKDVESSLSLSPFPLVLPCPLPPFPLLPTSVDKGDLELCKAYCEDPLAPLRCTASSSKMLPKRVSTLRWPKNRSACVLCFCFFFFFVFFFISSSHSLSLSLSTLGFCVRVRLCHFC